VWKLKKEGNMSIADDVRAKREEILAIIKADEANYDALLKYISEEGTNIDEMHAKYRAAIDGTKQAEQIVMALAEEFMELCNQMPEEASSAHKIMIQKAGGLAKAKLEMVDKVVVHRLKNGPFTITFRVVEHAIKPNIPFRDN